MEEKEKNKDVKISLLKLIDAFNKKILSMDEIFGNKISGMLRPFV